MGSSAAEEGSSLANVIIVMDGTEVLDGCNNLANAYLLLMVFFYSMNLSYLPKLRHTFKAFQKLFFELGVLKFPLEVHSFLKKAT